MQVDTVYWVWEEDNRVNVHVKLPSNCTFQATVLFTGCSPSINLILAYQAPYDSTYTWPCDDVKMFYNINLLKSNLQKAVRRQNGAAAMSTARQLMVQDMAAFLRRLTIVAIEDVRVCRGLEHVNWLMAAHSKGFVLQPHHYAHLLGFVHYLVKEPVYDRIEHIERRSFVPQLKQMLRSPLHMALGVRIGYGGMDGDRHLLYQTMLRLQVNSNEYPNGWASYDEPITPFAQAHMLKEAVDFHCTSIAVEACRALRMSLAEVKRLTWIFRSSVNARQLKKYPAWTIPTDLIRWLDDNSMRHWCADMKVRPERGQRVGPTKRKVTDYF